MTHRSPTRLLDAIFHEGPIFRMGFDAHVRAWKRATANAGFLAFNSSPEFRAAYRARGGDYLGEKARV